ncbi:MAG: 23S rRNA (guanosine(2251)-2'-O)-methyltransferase RlmB [Spirochaetales bacterium]|nr:23S rRNA (guanosine(2251)-2'-O)-methyltransferase RlmB [Spirochaetales bacterium]
MTVVHGFHVIEEYLKSRDRSRMRLLVAGKGPRIKQILELAAKSGIAVEDTTKGELDRLCGTRDHRGVALEVESVRSEGSPLSLETVLEKTKNLRQSLIIVLDGITDPHNLGAIIRSCDQFGVDAVIIPQRRSAKETLTVQKTSAGANRFVQVLRVPNLERSIGMLKKAGYWVCGADMTGESINRAELGDKTAVVMGSEGEGMSRIIRESCDSLISIPAKGHVDSFNVSVAAGIILYECRRQHGW